MKKFFLFLILLVSAVSTTVQASALHDIIKKITNIKQRISYSKIKYNHLEQELKNTEIKIGHLSIRINDAEHDIKQQKIILKKLKQKQLSYKKLIHNQQEKLSEQIRNVYTLGRQSYFKLLLRQKHPAEVSRMVTYYHYFMKNQAQLISQLQKTLNKLHGTSEDMYQHTQKLIKARRSLQQKRRQLTIMQHQRKQIIANLELNLKTNQEKLKTLIKNKRHLMQVVSTVSRKKMTTLAGAPFSKRKGKLLWPAIGQVGLRFGVPIQHSQLRTNGILIKAPVGASVRAVAPGRVVFADWLPGFGLLLIIQHDHGYMTIYGHNHSLYKKVGDIVKSGELIAKVGRSGGSQYPALYFAIRHLGKPLNPSYWLS